MLEFEIQNPSYERPEISDFVLIDGSVEQVRHPKVFRTSFLFLSAKCYLFKGLFIKPSIGFAANKIYGYAFPLGSGDLPFYTSVRSEAGVAFGISAGYEFYIKCQMSLYLEAAYRIGK